MTGCVAAIATPAVALGKLVDKESRWAAADLTTLTRALADLERISRGRLGVGLLNTSSGQAASYRGDEKFLMLSTFKTLSAAYILARSDQGIEKLARRMPISRSDILEYAPVTRRHVGPQGMTLKELCHAAITTSDNTAANLMHRSYGGPQALTEFLRSIGDTVTRHDRYEPGLNVPDSSQPLDTTSPIAMSRTLAALLFGTALKSGSQKLLRAWLMANTTGDKRLRAGLPSSWQVGEKTGTAQIGANDAGFVEAPQGPAVIVSAYLETDAIPPMERDRIIAEVGKRVADLMRSFAS